MKKIPIITVEMLTPADHSYTEENALQAGRIFFKMIRPDQETVDIECEDLAFAMQDHRQTLESAVEDTERMIENLKFEIRDSLDELDLAKEDGDGEAMTEIKAHLQTIKKSLKQATAGLKKHQAELMAVQSDWKGFLCAWLNHRCHRRKSPVAVYTPFQ